MPISVYSFNSEGDLRGWLWHDPQGHPWIQRVAQGVPPPMYPTPTIVSIFQFEFCFTLLHVYISVVWLFEFLKNHGFRFFKKIFQNKENHWFHLVENKSKSKSKSRLFYKTLKNLWLYERTSERTMGFVQFFFFFSIFFENLGYIPELVLWCL